MVGRGLGRGAASQFLAGNKKLFLPSVNQAQIKCVLGVLRLFSELPQTFQLQEMKWEKQHSLEGQKGRLQDKRKAHILGFKKKKKKVSSQPFQLRDSACSLPSLLLDLGDKNSVFFCYQLGIKGETLYFTGDQTFNFRS